MWRTSALALLASTAVLPAVYAESILKTNGFSDCGGDGSITVNKLDISFDKGSNEITFDVQGDSDKEQEVTATLVVDAYGIKVFEQEFDPCDEANKVEQLCPVPRGSFGAQDSLEIPSEYISKIPSIAFSVPDLDGSAKMILKAKDGGDQVACIDSGISNGKTVELAAVSYVAAAIAAGALVTSLVGAAASGGGTGTSTPSPGFFEVMWWFQGIAMNGMHSVNYPSVYRSFTRNFAFSTGVIPWEGMQRSIDNFRKATGGNLTESNYEFLQNATLVFPDNSTAQTNSDIIKRSLVARAEDGGDKVNVDGITAFVEQYSVPEENTFMTVLLVFSIVVAAIVVGILLFKVILEAWSLWGKYPKSLITFRKEYWRIMGQTIVNLILLLYGIWTLYCIFQFTHGDSWAAKLLAGLVLAGFTAVLGFYIWKITSVVRKIKKTHGNASGLFDDKPTWKKYYIFYGNYKTGYWWLFIPFIVYMFAKGCILAAGTGHGLVQSAGQLIVEALMLILLLWSRPYNRKSGNWINIIIQVVRVLSVICILVFVQELGIAQTTSTITGVVLIVVQSVLTGVLAILILVNAIINCCKDNPHRKRRKEAAKLAEQQRDLEGDAFLMEPQPYSSSPPRSKKQMAETDAAYEPMRGQATDHSRDPSQERGLMHDAAGMGTGRGGYHSVNRSESSIREPTLPQLDFGSNKPTQPYRDGYDYNTPNYHY